MAKQDPTEPENTSGSSPASPPPGRPIVGSRQASDPGEGRHFTEDSKGEVGEAIDRLKVFWERFGTPIMTVLAVTLIGLAAYQYLSQREITQRNTAWSELSNTTEPTTFRTVAEEFPRVRAVAYLHGADLLNNAAVVPEDVEEGEPSSPDSQAANGGESEPPTPDVDPQHLANARSMYQAALEASDHPALRGNALLGLGTVAESLGEWEAAERHYTEAARLGGGAELIAELAARRLDLLPTLRRPVTFGEAEEPAPADETPEGLPGDDELQLDFGAMPSDAPAEPTESP